MFGAGNSEFETKPDRGIDIGVTHVVPISNPGHRGAAYVTALLEPGLHIGQQLAGME